MSQVIASVGSATARDESELRELYEGYRRRQARRLVAMLPREAVRPLYRAALHASPRGASDPDPLRLLVEYCATLLPLPPFSVWVKDHERFPSAHLREWAESADPPTAADPVTLARRRLRCFGESWEVRVRAFHEGGAWRGFIAFEGSSPSEVHDTAVVFRETGPEQVRERFLDFEEAALEAFLRSTLP
ncbi:MAG: hypothetical protein U5R14_13405 [Gemmatimonadota bacterium]|nr:hypothetical protein [Gemmatimonadota bacterium]